MATEPQLHPQHNDFTLVARTPTVRPQTRTKIIEILAGNANGCLQELGYTPGLLERIRQFEELTPKLKAVNDDLLRKGQAWQAHAQAYQAKAERFKMENVKLFEDNVKLVSDCGALRAQLASMQNRCIVYEQSRGKDGAELLKQYATLAGQYAEAVKELQRQNNTNALVAARPSQPQASGSQMREIRQTFVPSQQPLRRASAPGLQQPPPLVTQGQILPPRAYPSTIQVPLMQRTSSAPLGWQQPPSPLPPTPTSASILNSSSYSRLIAGGLPYNSSGNVNMSAGTGTAPLPPTSPMSALPLNLQNFASPASQPALPRTASASSSQSHRTPVALQSPNLPSASTSVPPTPPEAPHENLPPEEMLEDIVAPDAHQASTPPEAHEAITPPPHAAVDASGVLLASDSLKRPSPGVDGEDPRKRARLEEPEVKMEVDSDTARLGGDDDEEEEEEEDGNEVDYIEVGADGLRTIPDCVNAVFDPDEGTVCRFCMARYDEDARNERPSERPQGLAGASVEELAAHCETEHSYAWGLLRKNV